jgi:hypothetical protein
MSLISLPPLTGPKPTPLQPSNSRGHFAQWTHICQGDCLSKKPMGSKFRLCREDLRSRSPRLQRERRRHVHKRQN